MTTLTKIIDRWLTAHDGQDLPHRSSFRPMLLGHLLSSTYILEEVESDIVFRLAGSQMEHIWGKALTNHTLTRLMDNVEHYNVYHSLMKCAFSEKCGLIFSGVIRDFNNKYYEMEEVILPYKLSKSGNVELIGVQLFENRKLNIHGQSGMTYVITGVTVVSKKPEFKKLPLLLQKQLEDLSVPVRFSLNIDEAA